MNSLISNNDSLFTKITELLLLAKKSVAQSVNKTIVFTYFEIGRMIVEEEQKGKERATYGKQVLKELSKGLTSEFGRGFSVENLDRMRFFLQNLLFSNFVNTVDEI